MRAVVSLVSLLALLLLPAAAQATGTREVPASLPMLQLPDAVPDHVSHLPNLPHLAGLLPGLPELPGPDHGQGYGPPDLNVPLGPPSPLPPEGLPPGLSLGPPIGVPVGPPPFTPIPEPATGLLLATGLGLLAVRRRSRVDSRG